MARGLGKRPEIEIRDPNGAIVGAVGVWTDLTIVERDNGLGAWSLTIPLTAKYAAELASPGYGIRIYDDLGTIMSGPMTEITGDTGAGELTLSGLDDLSVLARRVTSPQPSTAAPPYNTAVSWTLTGPAETVIKTLADLNTGPSAITARRWPGFSVAASQGRGSTVSASVRWDPLLDASVDLAKLGGLSLVCKDLVFDVRAPRDLTNDVGFSSERGSLASAKFRMGITPTTYVFVGGAGEGVARQVIEQSNATALNAWGRIEAFRDARDADTVALLNQRATDSLGTDADRLGIDIEVVPIGGCEWRTDWATGDTVTVSLPWGTYTRRITETKVSWTAEGDIEIVPTVGALGPDQLTMMAAIAQQRRRLSVIETV